MTFSPSLNAKALSFFESRYINCTQPLCVRHACERPTIKDFIFESFRMHPQINDQYSGDAGSWYTYKTNPPQRDLDNSRMVPFVTINY